ncbi:hypothetical protein G7092_10635 [Mucilaginibacter sp. HC2]|uniref:hypothetical protein n=1 Tax=Mucilaginibacter inviolabilis TaxID=2714892 RepID=UPI00140A95E4|nr:hypothetical protein [Mucilaginibacter inviolabilis]NHA04255.1 hypothetical protein [Mucilaginibacter inviolabilis]
MLKYFTINTVSEFICFGVALFCLFKDKSNAWRFFIVYLLVTCIVEILGIQCRKVWHTSNFMLYNIFVVVECTTISCFFYYLYKQYQYKSMWLIVWLIVFFVCYGAEMVTEKFNSFVFETTTLMSIVFVLASLNYYYLILKDEQFRQLSNYAPFWWVNGVLFFYFGSTACNIFFDYFMEDKSLISGSVRYMIFNIIDIILYCCWSYSFICRYRQRTLQRSSY